MVKRYPAIELVSRWGRLGALLVALLAGVVAIACYWQSGSILGVLGSIVGAIALYGLLRIGAEMIEVISETLLPQ